jgi:hypothetical protein
MTFNHHESAGRADRRDPSNVNDPNLAGLESDEGWLYASSVPVGLGDPGRFHALFGRERASSLQARISTAFGPDVMALEADGTEWDDRRRLTAAP